MTSSEAVLFNKTSRLSDIVAYESNEHDRVSDRLNKTHRISGA